MAVSYTHLIDRVIIVHRIWCFYHKLILDKHFIMLFFYNAFFFVFEKYFPALREKENMHTNGTNDSLRDCLKRHLFTQANTIIFLNSTQKTTKKLGIASI